jgi:hypothetical protein
MRLFGKGAKLRLGLPNRWRKKMADDDDTRSSSRRTASHASGSISDDVWNEATNEWLANSMKNSAMSADSSAWNHLVGALADLRRILNSKM